MDPYMFGQRWDVLVLLFGVVSLTASTPVDDQKISCGYQSCNPTKGDLINVHIVPHTHDDVGWLKTVDQYYYGSNNTIQKAGVQYIIDSVVDALRKDPSRRFIYVETAFLWKWWIQQHDIVKAQFKKLINNGQLEIIGGAWSMNDEAVTHYQSIIDQFTWGLRKLNESFGVCSHPKIGWQIDPFGHSREMASLFSQLGFSGIFLGRIDYQDKRARFDTKSAEMIWKSSASLGSQSDIFTSVLYNTYSPPPGFCFDILCNDDPIIDSKKSPIYNLDKKISNFLDYVKNMTRVYRSNNVLVTMGEDFNYQDANIWFKNLDKLIMHINLKQKEGSKYNLLYSTPSCYLKSVHEEAKKKNLTWMVKTDDFFPYASDEHSYWTGYFTSRPTIKRFERVGNNFLQVCKQLYALADLGPEDKVDLNALREAMGVMQHHDAVTGTEKQHVANDYARMLSKGIEECSIVSKAALKKLSTNGSRSSPPPDPYQQCQFNISECALTEKETNFVVTIYNPLSRPVDHYVRLPVLDVKFIVLDPEGKSIPVEKIPLPRAILKIPGRKSLATHEILFLAADLPPLGFKTFYVTNNSTESDEDEVFNKIESTMYRNNKGNVEIRTNTSSFTYDENTGLLAGIHLNGMYIPMRQQFLLYGGAVGSNSNAALRSSGAYIFRPNGTSAYTISKKATVESYLGNLTAEIRQTFNDWISQTIRIYNMENFVEFDWLIGPIPQDQKNGKEIITRYTTGLQTNSAFYTDSNGREVLKRVRNFRPTWKFTGKENVSANYYPITSKISIRDEKKDLEVSILTDRSQGGSSLTDGEIELMVHRDCIHDDAFGVNEALQEKAYGKGLVVRGSHYLMSGLFSKSTESESLASQQKDVAQRKLLSAWTFLAPTNGLSFQQYKAKHLLVYNGLTRALPRNVQILTFEPWIGKSFLLRLEHVFEAREDPTLSISQVVDLYNLFVPFEITSISETTLGANQWLEENKRLRFNYTANSNLAEITHGNANNDPKWRIWKQSLVNSNSISTTDKVSNKTMPAFSIANKLKIELKPMQIRTFILDIKKK
ncbi:lysosomal alpha-mannosidase-like [Agrilus planipennis]|uniref:Alpha-mannosidase n=1 Tax=Agrilus planipennis TaxID=224129 RepID=A0A1W4WS90_AGRPL|nr:lysosomal alpha-mannosidase-like [Agrilus planipennis]XP_018323358.1 lysosomal alpha-mannosidase-like [Agrilus planipennis]